MEKTSAYTLSPSNRSLFFADFDGFLFFHRILIWVIKSFYFTFLSFFKSQVEFVFGRPLCSEKPSKSFSTDERMVSVSKKGGLELSEEEVEMVMMKLGLFSNSTFKECLGLNEISVVFEEDEPSLEEIKEAFLVFDENRDGFIDAEDLQRVLCNLGFMEGSSIHIYERMIKAHDKNRDGRIDFIEFVKLMENSFC